MERKVLRNPVDFFFIIVSRKNSTLLKLKLNVIFYGRKMKEI